MKVSAYFAQGKRNEWEFSRCPCQNSFSKLPDGHRSGPCLSRMNIFHKAFCLHFLVAKTQFYGWASWNLPSLCDKGNILRNKYLAAQSWMRIPIKIEFHEFTINEFHLFSFLRYTVKGSKSSNTRI